MPNKEEIFTKAESNLLKKIRQPFSTENTEDDFDFLPDEEFED